MRFEKVSKQFNKMPVLHEIDLAVRGGETLCLVGPSGAGKSTLLRCANLLEVPDNGRIFIDDEAITDRSANVDRIRRRVGMVFQLFRLFPNRSVLDNGTLALQQVLKVSRDEAVAKARRHLESVGLDALRDRRPSQLSGGQPQRVAIARALAMNPEVMLFDEATSALDPELVSEVLAVMRDLAGQGMTMIVVTHEMNFAREIAHQVAFLDRGRLVESAPPQAFFGAPENPRLREFLEKMP